MACIYDINATWEENLRRGPAYDGPLPDREVPPEDEWFDFLGYKLVSRVGVPAGPLLDSKWTALAGRLGYDLVTYKTIRTQYSPGHGLPNVLYLAATEQLPAAGGGAPLTSAGTEPPGTPAAGCCASANDCAAAGAGCGAGGGLGHSTAKDAGPAGAAGSAGAAGGAGAGGVAITNSFGMPSMGRDYLMRDIPAAQAALAPGQLLVVSVTGTPGRGDGVSFEDDFVEAALLAKAAGAKVVEANYSCPNVGRGQGALYTDPDQVAAMTRLLVAALGPDIPLIIKVGAFDDDALLERVLLAAAGAGARGVAGINGLSRTIVTPDGAPALGPERPTSGVCGAPIRAAALAFVAAARQIIRSRDLGLVLVGVGGVTAPEHIDDMLAAGADVVQSATGMMWRPLLAAEWHAARRAAGAASAVKGAAGSVAAAAAAGAV